VIRFTDNHGDRLKRLALHRLTPGLGEVLLENAQTIVDFARVNINDGSVSGPGHVPGPVGGYPNSDTHELEQSLHVGELIETGSEIKTSAIADAPHAIYVERGTSNAGPRPYIEPSTEEVRPHVLAGLASAFRKVVND
jgi:hypothetical protein